MVHHIITFSNRFVKYLTSSCFALDIFSLTSLIFDLLMGDHRKQSLDKEVLSQIYFRVVCVRARIIFAQLMGD